MERVKGVAEERGVKFGNNFDSVKGFIEFELEKNNKEQLLNQNKNRQLPKTGNRHEVQDGSFF